ncbi:proteasome-type protease [Janthinobacterium aquaticum]|uniref:proteasome-type protease n=1 Tax=Janthinobacterium sp. FT58W TaxID=2654254 RepID=UPI001265A357|nr:proteasome-type protease [Janthinobacterium sp. FT58W]KAB8041554.1 peptidase [Janthinobacterium sp. FT58W]
MTYCIGMRLNQGLVFLSDSRTNAGVDQVGTFRKMSVFENPGERMLVLMTAGNLSISQAIRQIVAEHIDSNGLSIWNVASMYDAARIVGEAVRTVHQREAKALADCGIDFNVSIIVGGQIGAERCRLFQVYSAGNFIESHDETTYFQIGEAKYGKPIIDRVITPASTLDEAAKCALISMDSTLKSNISVGLPLDLLVYEAGSLAVTRFVTIDEKNRYFRMIRDTWGEQLKSVFENMDNPVWDVAPGTDGRSLASCSTAGKPVRMTMPAQLGNTAQPTTPMQSLAQQVHNGRQH